MAFHKSSYIHTGLFANKTLNADVITYISRSPCPYALNVDNFSFDGFISLIEIGLYGIPSRLETISPFSNGRASFIFE